MGPVIWAVPLSRKKNGPLKEDIEIMAEDFNTFREMRDRWVLWDWGGSFIMVNQRRLPALLGTLLHCKDFKGMKMTKIP